jgi:hypothetical protein
MRTAVLCAALLLVTHHPVVASDPAASWNGVKVMPRLGTVIKTGDRPTAAMGCDSLWVVQGVNDNWRLTVDTL